MAYPYQKHIWVSKEIIRRDYLQNIEDGIYDEQQERLTAEAGLSDSITAEATLARNAEQTITGNLNSEITRATGAEGTIASNLADEIARATGAESDLTDNVTNLSERITDESDRAVAAETDLSDRLTSEINRATQAEDEMRTTLTSAYKASGSVYFSDLPLLADFRLGNVYDIKDAFTTTSDFVEGSGKEYPAGTNVAIVGIEGDYYTVVIPQGDEDPSELGWYVYVNDEYVLTSDTEVVSGTTYYSYSNITYKYDVMPGFVDTSHLISDTDYATAQTAGIVKPDGSTTTVDENGVIHATGGSGGTGGHTIVDENGTAYTQRTKLKITKSIITDDSSNDTTVVTPDVDFNFVGTRAAWDLLSTAEKAQYKTMDFTDDYNGFSIDDVPTEDSQNVVKSGGIYDAIVSVNSTLTNEVETRSTNGAHNLLRKDSLYTEVKNGVTFTVNSDGSVTVSTTNAGASADTYKRICNDYAIGVGNYVLTGCPSGGSSNSYCLFATGFTNTVNDFGDGANFTANNNEGYVGIYIKSGTIITTPITFYPMIRLASDPDDTYQPYAMTNRELTEKLKTAETYFNLDSSMFNNVSVKYKKRDNLVTISFHNKSKVAIPAHTIIGTLPSAIAPSSHFEYLYFMSNLGMLYFDGSGNIYSPAMNVDNWMYATATYII